MSEQYSVCGCAHCVFYCVPEIVARCLRRKVKNVCHIAICYEKQTLIIHKNPQFREKKKFCFSYEIFVPKNLKKVRKQKYVSQPHLNSTCIILAPILSELLSRIFDLSWEKWFQFPWLSKFSQEASVFPERWWWWFLRLPFLKVCVNMRLIVWMIMAAAVY